MPLVSNPRQGEVTECFQKPGSLVPRVGEWRRNLTPLLSQTGVQTATLVDKAISSDRTRCRTLLPERSQPYSSGNWVFPASLRIRCRTSYQLGVVPRMSHKERSA